MKIKTTALSLIIFISIIILFTACETLSFTENTYPRVDGSTATLPMAQAIAQVLTEQENALFIRHNQTHQAYVNLIDKNTDLIIVSEPSDEELAYAKAKEVTLDMKPAGLNAFVFVVNVKNPINGLTIKQIQDIYQGKITNWKDVGGTDTQIKAFQRNQNSGSQTLMEKVVMKGLTMMKPPVTQMSDGMGDVLDRIADYDNAEDSIGYSIYYFEKYMHPNPNIKLISVEGIMPSDKSIEDMSYPYTGNAYVIIRADEPFGSPARKLRDWITSPQSKEAVTKGGFIPIYK